jgi:hypothetical protein
MADRTPDQDGCDLFSREARPGFDGWRKEHGKFDLVGDVRPDVVSFAKCRKS